MSVEDHARKLTMSIEHAVAVRDALARVIDNAVATYGLRETAGAAPHG